MSDNVEYKIYSYKKQANLPNGKSYFTVSDVNIDKTQCSMALIGKNMPNYGETQSENYLHLLQNFCTDTENAPGTSEPAVEGQLWYEKLGDSNYCLKVCTNGGVNENVKWDKIIHMYATNTIESSAIIQQGDLWYNTSKKILYVYNNGWNPINLTDIDHITSATTEEKITDSSGMVSIELSNDVLKYLGCTSLMIIKVVIKENRDTNTATTEYRCKSIILKCMVQSIKYKNSANEDRYTCKIIGTPTYEIIAQNDISNYTSDNWSVNVDIDDSKIQPVLLVKVDADVRPNCWNTVVCHTDVERV